MKSTDQVSANTNSTFCPVGQNVPDYLGDLNCQQNDRQCTNSLKTAEVRRISGFTIVELLIVIVIIGILAAITIVSYSGITQKANTAALQSDLTNASKKLALYYAVNNTYPTALDQTTGCPTAPTPDTENCIKVKTGTTLSYYGNAKNFTLSLGNNNSNATINNDSSPKTLSLSAPTDCPAGYIPVPGSLIYGTSGFCVMKYEAKNDGSGNAVSTAAGTPYVSINQTDSKTKSAAACTGCHLITEAEWMTIAQNVLSVPSNWSSGTVGTGFIYSGHNDNAPAAPLAAVTDDADGYNGTGQTTGSNQKRTLTLTNGQVIWDMAGNVWEWTSGQTTGDQPGGATAGYAWREWSILENQGNLTVNPSPAGVGLTNSNIWNSSNGIGQLYSNANDMTPNSFLRGGKWNSATISGLVSLYLGVGPNFSDPAFGFRVTR